MQYGESLSRGLVFQLTAAHHLAYSMEGAVMGEPEGDAAYQEVRDWYGRRYRVGEDPVALIGRPRSGAPFL